MPCAGSAPPASNRAATGSTSALIMRSRSPTAAEEDQRYPHDCRRHARDEQREDDERDAPAEHAEPPPRAEAPVPVTRTQISGEGTASTAIRPVDRSPRPNVRTTA